MATHFSILAWRIPGTEEPGGLQTTGHKESDTTERTCAHTHTHTHTRSPSWMVGKLSLNAPVVFLKSIQVTRRCGVSCLDYGRVSFLTCPSAPEYALQGPRWTARQGWREEGWRLKARVGLTPPAGLAPGGPRGLWEQPFGNSLSLQHTVFEFLPAGKLTRCSHEVIQGVRLQESYRLGVLHS